MAGTRVVEIERKFDVEEEAPLPSPQDLPGVARVDRPVEHRLEAEYFDTEDLRLASAWITLRRRTGGEDAGWHLKLPAGPILLLSNQMLNSTLEEKENRVTEMILTTLNPTTLITGKIIALFMIGLVQILVFLTPIAVAYIFFRDKLAIPDLDPSTISFEPGTIIVGALLLLGGFTVFTGVLVAIGAIMPTAKDAGTIFGPLMAMIFIPFYAISLIISDPRALIVQIFTYFPLSAPVTAMLRNAFGTLSPLESTIIIAGLFITGFLILRLAVHLFRYGSIQYSSKLSIAGTFHKRTAPSLK